VISLSSLRPIPKSNATVIALVEDDRLLREEVAAHLSDNHFLVHAVNSASALDDLVARTPIGLFIIDLNLPGEDGLSLCKRLRASIPQAGIIILTARTAMNDRIAGYQKGGADFYLTKPVIPDELVLILLSLDRRIKHTEKSNEWTLDLRNRTLISPSSELILKLTSREKILLVALAQANENTLSSGALCDLYEDDSIDNLMSKHALEELIARLRKKFKQVQLAPDQSAIQTVWGVGYQLSVTINFIY